MNYQDWEKGVPEVFTSDALWNMKVYRLHRMGIFTRIAQLLLTTIANQRHKTFKEEQTPYQTEDERRMTENSTNVKGE